MNYPNGVNGGYEENGGGNNYNYGSNVLKLKNRQMERSKFNNNDDPNMKD